MKNYKPIETKYKGYRFRSRLEARWAVFFDHAKIKWEYEPEGFELDCGSRYLPDFFLPDVNSWVEIKGKKANDRELSVCQSFSKSLHPVSEPLQLTLLGHPSMAKDILSKFYKTAQEASGDLNAARNKLLNHLKTSPKFFLFEGFFESGWMFQNGKAIQLYRMFGPFPILGIHEGKTYYSAIDAGKSARFEFGESGAGK